MRHPHYLQVHPKSTVEDTDYYRPDIDGLRGIAVCLVILYHIFPMAFKNGFLGVDVFFIISGFVVTQALQRNLTKGYLRGLIDFYIHRIKRILPALYVNIVVCIFLSCLLIPPSDLQSIFKTAASAIVAVSNLALLYASFDYFNPDLSLNPFVHTWSLGVEEQFYFVFPLLLICALYLVSLNRRIKVHYLLFLLALLSFLYWTELKFSSPVSAFYNPMARFWELLIGVILSLNKDAIVSFIKARVSILLQCFASALFVIGLSLPPAYDPLGYFANLIVVAGSAIVITAGISSLSGLNKVLSSEPLVWTGRLSYSLYLWHAPIFTFFRWNSDLNHPVYALLALLITVIVSFISYRYIEIPFRYASIKGVKVIYTGATIGMVSLLFVFLLYQLPPARIYLGNSENYTDLWPHENVPVTTSLAYTGRDCHLEYHDELLPDSMDGCSTTGTGKNYIYLIGNSHTQHLIPMIDLVSKNMGYGYTALTISNCRLVSAFQIIESINFRYDLCKDYFDYSTNFVINNAKPGDIVLVGARSLLKMPSRLNRGSESNVYVEDRPLSRINAYEKSISDLSDFSRALYSNRISLIFAGPTPAFTLTATQCAPEWFRSNKTGCKVSIEPVLVEQESYFVAVAEIMANSKNGYLWDPMSSLCDDKYCYPSKGDKLLFRDKHHLSVYGSEFLAPSFINFVNRTR